MPPNLHNSHLVSHYNSHLLVLLAQEQLGIAHREISQLEGKLREFDDEGRKSSLLQQSVTRMIVKLRALEADGIAKENKVSQSPFISSGH